MPIEPMVEIVIKAKQGAIQDLMDALGEEVQLYRGAGNFKSADNIEKIKIDVIGQYAEQMKGR